MACSGSNIVCKFSFAKLNEACNFGSNEIKAFKSQRWSYEEKQQLLNKLAELMLDYKKALCIASYFRGMLLEILERTQHLIQRNVKTKNFDHLNFSVTLSHLLYVYSYILPFVLTYFQENGPFFSEGMNTDEYSLVIETASRFLSFSPTTFREIWNWGILCEINHSGSDSDKNSIRTIISIVLNCNNKEISKLRTESYDDSSVIAGRILGEKLCQTRNEDDIGTANENEEDLSEIVFTEPDLFGSHTIMANMLIPRISKTILSSQELIVVPSMRKNVDALTSAVVSGKSILISGAVGSGKTALVEYFASLTGRNKPPYLFKVQLGDQTDSKALIGSYCCSDVPGEFVWRPGVLTRAVREGRWLMLEDIDCAPMDVISVLIHLLESRVLSIPGKENIKAAPGFQLFATQRIGQIGRGSFSESSMLEHLWSKVTIEPLTKTELKEIVVTKFPTLKPLADKLVDTFSLLSCDLQLNAKPDTRNTSLSADKRLSTVRDFMKWCRRLHALSNAGPTLLSSQDIFQEAMDCFCATISNVETRTSMALAIGAKLNLNKDKVEFVSNIYKPSVKVAPLCFTVGRMTLNREQADERIEKVNFAFTRHSLILLESLAACVSQNEPVLLVGETGTGKTSVIQYLASLCNRRLVVVNMSQQSDSTDLIGGFKPMEMKQLVAPVREQFETLFCKTFSRSQNFKFLMNVQQCFGQRRWEVLFKAMMHTRQAALARLSKETGAGGEDLLSRWRKVGQQIQHLRQQLKQAVSAQMFSFVEGALVKAIRRGDWVLLDEINLATPETLECLNGILESQQGSIVVLERGDAEPIVRHEEFRMFACMNPANDVGKKDLPAGIRNRFTEIFVNELQDIPDLKTLVFSYLQGLSPPATLIDGIVSFYVGVREVASRKLTDGSGNRPYYSLRTLCRALKYASQNPHGNILRSVHEGFCISFLTQLDRSSHSVVETLLQEKLLSNVNARSLIRQPLRKPDLKNEKFLNFEGYWICQGNLEPTQSSNYVFTSTVNDNLKCLARIVSGRDFPVLIQGETSVGKTSLINWLSKASGNYCVRINNHEHTDIQEYLGCYTSDASGKLVFKEGILVDAMRKGYWIILDELNLAPTDVLEALNRLLDDNRELFIPEIQETVKAHPKFMLFATQNPPGHYGGRKVLSRAFRNRFVELHFEELPSKELETILHKRCSLPLSYSKTLVNIMLELQVRRRGSTVFSGKQGFITLRDLFRWADRYSKSQNSEGTFFDWNQQLAEDGYFLLAGKCRNAQEALVVQEVIEKLTKRRINGDSIFGHPSMTKLSSFSEKILSELINNCPLEFRHVVFTYNMRRLAVLVARALQFNEPILLVGETGCGKTTICQVFAALQKKKLYAVNCHLHTETSDFLGGLRPARREANTNKDGPLRLFEWCDGSLVEAMKEGSMFLADEISLADDSVLERLNSVLEPERTLILAEKGSSSDYIDLIVAEQGFQLLATMNPGGDYGKKELSPALRNRFTEVWCPAYDSLTDMIAIIEHNVSPGVALKPQPDGSSGIGMAMVEFIEWFRQNNFGKRCIVTVRDCLSWVQFINVCCSKNTADQHTQLEPSQAYFHGAFLVFLDALGLGEMVNSQSQSSAGELCLQFLLNQLKDLPGTFNGIDGHTNATDEAMDAEDDNSNKMFTFGVYSIPRGPELSPNIHDQYALNAPTTAANAERVMRAMQLHRPILLEGSPGVGKTSLVSALAKASGHRLVRINLSEQTDISDLFGADLPVEGVQGCQFSWCDGPLLLALKSGSWIVLDELNLASQSVLEGLNACFDHRGEIFIPELGMSFPVQHKKTKFFACQNPLHQGGGRKGLPKSFLNRFTQVHVEPLTHNDLLFITQSMYPKIDKNILEKMITFNAKVYQHCVIQGLCRKHGGSWEFNLRDIFRWCDLMTKYQSVSNWNPVAFVRLIYVSRMRTEVCTDQVWELCSSIFGKNTEKDGAILVHSTPSNIQIGKCVFPKYKSHMEDGTFQAEPLYILHRTLKPLESLLICLKMNWLALLVGPKSSGKTSLVRLAAQLTGTKLDVMAMNSSIDTTELLGGYEQTDLERQWTEITGEVKEEVFRLCRSLLLKNRDKIPDDLTHVLKQWFTFRGGNDGSDKKNVESMCETNESVTLDDISRFHKLLDAAINVCQRHSLTDYCFERLKVRVEELNARLLQSNGSSHISGQFEWVDGQLVKALKNGHWLLIDNVNFCSPSVLDRLNGLLEPEGELSINERGVVDGEIPVIKPHPDFRLIFAMDSKHGEISRAMRNRGVEIFLMQEDSDIDDLCSMLYASGCKNSTAIQTLLNIRDQGTILQTIHAGSLMNELWQRGIVLEKSLFMSLNHVYGQRSDLKQLLAEQSVLKLEKKPSAKTFQQDGIRAMIKWHSIPLDRIIQDASNLDKNVMTAIKIFVEWCSKKDWRMRLDWLTSNMRSCTRKFQKKRNSLAATARLFESYFRDLFNTDAVKQFYDTYEHLEMEDGDWEFDASDQPVNISVNGPVFKYICCKIQGDEKKSLQFKSHSNRVYLLWTMNDFRMEENSQLRGSKIGILLHSLYEYTVLFLTQPESNDILVTDDDVYKIWVSLKQLFCNEFSSDSCVYWKLVGKGALDTMMKFFEDVLREDHPMQKYSHPVVKHLDKMSESEELAVCHWKMIKDFEVSTVFVSEEICLLWTKLFKLYAGLFGHNSATEEGVGLTLGQTRRRQIELLNDMVSLIRIREEEVPKEEAEIISARIKESIMKISQERCHEEIMDQSASDILASFSEISIDERSDRIYGSEIIQDYCTAVANCAYSGYANLLKLMALRKKILKEKSLPISEAKWNEKLNSYVNFCVGYLREIPFNTAFIQSVLQNSKNNCFWSILKLADDSVFCDLTEIKYPQRNAVSNVTCLLPNTGYFVKTFEEMSLASEHSYLKTDQKQTQIRLVDVEDKIVEYNHFTTFLWLHQNFLANLKSTQWSVDGKAFTLAFTRLVLCLNCIDEIPDYHSILSNFPSFLKTVLTTKEFQQRMENFFTDFQQHGRILNSSIDSNVVKECFSRVIQHLELIVDGEVITDNSKKIESKFDRGLCWIYLGIIQSTLLRPVGNIDPVEETNIRVDMIRRQVEDLSSELNVRLKYEEILTGVAVSEAIASDTLQVNPRHVKNLVTYRKSLECELSKVGDKDRYRPVPSQFKEITGVLQDFSSSVGNYSSTFSKINDLCSHYKHDSSDEKKCQDFVTYAKESIIYLKTWVKSVRKFILQLQDFEAYQDILGPYISALIQIVRGSEMIISDTENKLKWIMYKRNAQSKLNVKYFLPGEIVSCVLPFSRYCGSMSRRVGSLLTEELSYGIEALCKSSASIQEDNEDKGEQLKTRVRMLALKVLRRSVCRKGYTNSHDILHLKSVTHCFKTLWLQHEKDRKLQEEEGESLFKFKTKTYCEDEESQDQQNQTEVDEMFPRFDQEYDDLRMDTTRRNSSSEMKQKFNQQQANRDTMLSESDMAQFCGIHQFLVSCAPNVSNLLATIDNTEWEKVDKRLDDVKIACEGYNIASEVISLCDLSDNDFVEDATPSHLTMSSLLLKSLSSCQDEFANTEQKDVRSASLLFDASRTDEYDIYHDSNLKEIVQVLPILASFKSRIQLLLEKWPEHPTLVQLCQTIDRIVSFPVTSPVMQILNGLEILLKYSQEWESNASRHVSIRDNLEEVTQMIVQWRKLELRCWSSLLRVCETKARKKAHHWWFHVHHVIQQCSVGEDGGSVEFQELIKVLQQFMESSSLGEFSERLKILASFYYQETIDDAEKEIAGIVRTILWNIFCYYKQFESRVGSLIEKAKAPIEKELKDFIKIIKWKDVNYWAMKETSAKSHHTLLKLIKKYQAALSEGIDGILGSVGQVQVSFVHPTEQDASSWKLEPKNFLSPISFQNLNVNLKDTDREDDRPPQTFSKMRKLAQRKLNSSRYDALSASVNTFAGEVVDTVHSLQNLEIGNKTGKERAQFCKHIHVLKKRALADLFKRLRKIGLSYRKGISILQKNSLKDPMMVDCGDIMRTLKNIDILFNSSENSDFLPVLASCTEYYQKCVARYAVLNNVLTSPSKDLTVGDVDRIKGFAEHLRQITQRQRENISMVGKSFSELSMITRQLKNIASRRSCRLPPQRNVAEWTLKLDDLLNSSLETSESLLCLLDTCPVSRIDLSMSPVPEQLSELSKCCKQDSVYDKLNKNVAAFHEKISQIKSKIYLQTVLLCPTSTGREEGNVFANWSHFECLSSSFEQLNETVLYLDEFVRMDTRPDLAKVITDHGDLGFGKMAFDLKQEIKENYSQFTEWYKKTFEETHCNDSLEEQVSPLRSEVTSTRNSILLSFQKWYKRRENEIDKAQESVANEEENNDDYFVERLDNELQADISILNIQETTKDIHSFIKIFKRAIDEHYNKYNSTSIDSLCKIVIGLLPFFSQYVLLIEYHFHQLLLCHRSSCKLHSVLLEIFSELLRKGFCLPADEDEFEGEGATSFEDAEDCGIGEGEGRKDVSDQIENEEQLLGGEQTKGEQHEKGDDNEIANEEHGIEMSEDFEGETHDVEKSGESSDEDGESGDESENLKQEMGDVDGADETLDKKLWADSDEEDNNDKEDDEDGRGIGADGENQSEMVAKEENQGSNKDGKNKMDDIDKDKINELGKDENDTGNLDDDFTDNKNEVKPDDPQAEEMELSENLDLDFDNDGDNDEGDVEDGMDDSGHDGETAENENCTDDEIGDNDDLQMAQDQEGNQEPNNEEEPNEEEQEAGVEKNEEDEGNVKGDEWKTQSEAKGENVESVEDHVNPDASFGISASNEGSEPTNNDESTVGGENQGTGNSMSQQSELDSSSSTTMKTTDLASTDTRSHRKQLNKSRNDRSLGSSEEAASKKPKVLNSSEDRSSDDQAKDTSSAELFEHIGDQNEMHDMQALDAATAEQQKQQKSFNYPTETEDHDTTENTEKDWELPPEDNTAVADGKQEKTKRNLLLPSDKAHEIPNEETNDVEMSISKDHDEVSKEWLDTKSSVFTGEIPFSDVHAETSDPDKCRGELEELLCKWRDLEEGSPDEQATALDAWHKFEQLTSTHSQQLCEQLRIVLEPSIASKLRGDYRTGKRLNMRKVIPYIASQYRKDKIWLRRTKKSKRQYQILLAVDDSSSMSDNKSKQLAFESLAVITNALTKLEAGEVAICSFGEEVQLLHPFHETFTEQSGANILRQFRFAQKKTKVAQLLDACTSVMTSSRSRATTGNDVSQLLLLVSDGRGIFLEGVETVQRAVRKAREAGIFLVFVILDNPTNRDSILDIKLPVFKPNQRVELKSYIEQFPFPFYIVLRDISSLPETLGDSLRQWFELVTNMS